MIPSWSRAQSDSFAAQGAAQRRETSATPALFAGKRLCVAFSAVKNRRDIEAGGFEQQPDFIGRVDAAEYPWFCDTPEKARAAVGQPITISGSTYKIVEVAPILLGGEIWLGLGKK